MNKDARIIFDFMKDILYVPKCNKIDVQSVSQDYREIAEGLNVFCDYVNEQREYADNLLKGNFEYVNNNKDNQLCWGMKSLQTEIRTFIYQLQNSLEGKTVPKDYANPMHTQFCEKVRELAVMNKEKDKLLLERDEEISRLKKALADLSKE